MKWKDDRLLYSGQEMFGPSYNPSQDYLPVDITDTMDEYLWVPDVHVIESNDFCQNIDENPAFVYPIEHAGMQDAMPWNVYLARQTEFHVYCNQRNLYDF